MRRTAVIVSLFAVLMTGALAVHVHLVRAQHGSPQTQTKQTPQRRFIDDIWDAPQKEVSKYVGSSFTTNANAPALTPNDPCYDPAWGALLDLPLTLGELQQRMQAGTLNAQPVYIVILDGSVMSHPDLDSLHESKYDKDFTPPGDPTLGSHATGCASIAVAKTNNGIGAASITGFTGTVKFISVRIFDTSNYIE